MKKILLSLVVALLQLTAIAQNKTILFEGPPVFRGAHVVGNYPGTDFIFTVAATGQRPITFTAANLPDGLKLDAATGIITGFTKAAGDFKVTITATNAVGNTSGELKIIVGPNLSLTPTMGWNSWNVFTRDIDEKMLMEMADAMVSTGMRDVGYQYLNIDDFWHADTRDKEGRPVADPKKFPHGIKYVADYVHSKGLKLGIYSCAGNMTCGRRFGGYSYEEIDAKAYAEWGVDLLKYDYCYAPWSPKAAINRYTVMGNALKKSGRSILLSVCEWGFRKPWKWATKAGGSYWRTTPDIVDTWNYPTLIFYSMMKIVNREQKLVKYAGPGHWNDPDMLIVGNYGKGKATAAGGKFNGLSDIEYQSHMSLWCMFAAPLLSSCDLRSMNEATANILTNPEILAINQDELGEQAGLISKANGVRVYLKHLKDGSMALAVLNTSKKEKEYKLDLKKLVKNDKLKVRDVWQHTDLGTLSYTNLTMKAHETIVLRLNN